MYRITQLREEKGLSQRALAKKIGASPKAVNFWESGAVEPSAKFICALADEFEVSCDYLLGREDDTGAVNVMRELNEGERHIVNLYGKLTPKQREALIDYASYLSDKIRI